MADEVRTTPRPSLDFEMVGIRLGGILVLYGAPEINGPVAALSPARVLYQGRVMSLTEAINVAYGVQNNDPAGAWCYEGETLRQRRERFGSYHCR